MDLYNHSLRSILELLFPEYRWLPWRFERASSGIWDDEESQMDFVEWFAEHRSLTSPEGWYRMSNKDLTDVGIYFFILFFSGRKNGLLLGGRTSRVIEI
jgi:hypothetical protein